MASAEGNTKILICEDDTVLLNILCYTFESRGFDVYKAEDVKTALLHLQLNRFDVVLTDSVLSDPTCLEFMSILEYRPPVFILTGGPTEEIERHLNDLNIHGIFKKPISMSVLVNEIQTRLDNKENILRSCKVLITDIKTNESEQLTRSLKNSGYIVDESDSWEETINDFEKRPDYYHILIIDSSLLANVGKRSIKSLLESSPSTLCIVMANDTSHIETSKLYKYGVHSVIKKPIDMKYFLVSMETYEKDAMFRCFEKEKASFNRQKSFPSKITSIFKSYFKHKYKKL